MQHDYMVCLECGFRGQAIRRRVSTRHGLEPEQYRDAGSCQPITRSPRRPIRIGGRPWQAVVSTPASEVLAPPRSSGPQTADGTQEVPPEMLTPTQQRAVDRFSKSVDARRRCFDRYLSSGLGGSPRRPCRGQRQSWQSERRKSCGQNGDAGALCGLSKPLQGAVPLNQFVPERSHCPGADRSRRRARQALPRIFRDQHPQPAHAPRLCPRRGGIPGPMRGCAAPSVEQRLADPPPG